MTGSKIKTKKNGVGMYAVHFLPAASEPQAIYKTEEPCGLLRLLVWSDLGLNTFVNLFTVN